MKKLAHSMVLIGYLSITILVLLYLLLIAWREFERERALNDFLNVPIPDYVADDLCFRNLVPPDISQCEGKIRISRRDIVKIFQSRISSQNTYDEVNILFGKYETFCYQRSAEAYRCYYQFGTEPSVMVEFSQDGNKVNFVR